MNKSERMFLAMFRSFCGPTSALHDRATTDWGHLAGALPVKKQRGLSAGNFEDVTNDSFKELSHDF